MKEFNRELLNKFTYTLSVRKYSENTIKNYCSLLKKFFSFTRKQSKDISLNDFDLYLCHISDSSDLSYSYHSQLVSSWQLYLSLMHGKKLKYDNKYKPKKSKKLINILSVSESWDLINAIRNPKQKAIISGIYLHGLRRSEILKVKYSDIDKNRNLLIIRKGKGNKDRCVPLNSFWLEILKEHARSENHKKGYDKPIFYPYSESSIYQTVKRKAIEVGIKKRVYPHLLRDCYASHLMEQGTDTRFIQEILGHENITTTQKYLHISAINISKIALKKVV